MPVDVSTRAGFMPARVVHLHPSRFCNLACKHCYSMSGPTERGALAPEAITSALALLRSEGYEVVSLSGGEPLLYSGFEEVVRNAVALGYRVNLITNGAPVGGKLLDIIAEHIGLIAISLDGPPDVHADLRNDARAFSRAERAMDRLSERGVRFGIAYCISRESLAGMPWLVEFAADKGASLVQFHPFAATGRGRQLDARLSLGESEKARAYVLASLLEAEDTPAIHIDLAPVEAARAQRNDYTVLGLEPGIDNPSTMLLSDLINPLVIDELGRVLPLSYGIDPQFALGRLGSDLPAAITRYKVGGWRDLYTLLDTSFVRLGAGGENFVDWFYHIVETSYTLGHTIKMASQPTPVSVE